MKLEKKSEIIGRIIPIIKESGMRHNDIASRLGINKCYIDYLTAKKEEYREKCMGDKPISAFDNFLKSGKKIQEYNLIPTAEEENLDSLKIKKVEKRDNDVIKDRLAEILISAIEKEGMNNNEAAHNLGLTPEVISQVRNPRLKGMCRDNVWSAIKKFNESGKPLSEYYHISREFKAVKPPECQKLVIEINLLINGKRIEI